MTEKQVRVGIVGFGTVGRATADIIAKHRDLIAQRSGVKLTVNCVCRRSGVPPRDVPVGALAVTDWKDLLKNPHVDVVVETMGGTGDARQLLRAALEQGKPVVTANKNLLAEHGDELFALAASHNLPIGFEASVAGGIPILRVIHESTAGDRLRSVHGILNGTANYILTQMATRGLDFDKLPTLPDLIAGHVPGRGSDQDVTCFLNNLGLGYQFAAAGALLYRKAKEHGAGHDLPTEWFTEDVHP